MSKDLPFETAERPGRVMLIILQYLVKYMLHRFFSFLGRMELWGKLYGYTENLMDDFKQSSHTEL